MNKKMLFIGKVEDGDRNLQPMNFMHPKHEKDCCYLIGKNIYEMQTFEDEDHCSLFIDNFVAENNKIYLINKMDPLYLLIPSLLRNRQKSDISDKFCLSPLDQLLNNNEMNHILSKLPSPNMELKIICKVQQIDDDIYCVLDDEKVVHFLDKKLEQIQIILTNNPSINMHKLNDALCIINEYIPNYFFEKLCQKYNLSAKRVINPRKRKFENDAESVNHNNKKRKLNRERKDDYEDGDDIMFSPKKRLQPIQNSNNETLKSTTKLLPNAKSRAITQLSKANTKGMKSMMSYFTKKKK